MGMISQVSRFSDILRDCRKSPKITILAISQLIKSITYKHQNYRFWNYIEFIAIVLGQSLIALVIDHFGLFASPKIEINLARGVGVLLVAVGAYLVGR